LDVARAFADRLGLLELYVADLDTIAGRSPDLELPGRLAGAGLLTWWDAGVRDGSEVARLLDAGVDTVVTATETLAGPEALERTVQAAGASRVVFGLDLRDGEPVFAPGSHWAGRGPIDLIEQAVQAGVRRVLTLDTGRVGSGRGVACVDLAEPTKRRHTGVEFSGGGGVAGVADLDALAGLGIDAALVASAFHDGRIRRADLDRLGLGLSGPSH
jgi:phosphoribosylformimino-5-aminoimidazole carboxamide ribotide isomerase